ncbi:glycosyltransferase family 2 protein [Georgenia muralis]|uniref:Glycosyl transferase family 2 n=1 Tax=Georgenia muralis TaxID=154117 RepID=A0A3N4ZKP9_9MICO|nr:glycosyltransferase family 2 protein [Georgenia muralis]RPF26388.1 hypothetical protein EDD32_0827 [Georgenia muralis]
MIGFITSLRHPLNASDYSRVEALALASLRSVCAQSSTEFHVVVVGNQPPGFPVPAQVTFVRVDFPPPSAVAGPQTGREAVLLDKGTKLAVGLLEVIRHNPSHVMAFDADDYVSRRIAAYVNRHHTAPGWYVQNGWRYCPPRRSVRPQPDFYRHCGTSHIIRADLFEAPMLDPCSVSQDELTAAFGDRLRDLLGSHVYAADRLAAAGTPLAPLPFPGALYTVGTGENHSGISMGGFGRPVSTAIAVEFGVPPTPRNPVARLRAVLPGGQAVVRRARSLLRAGGAV